MAVAGFLYLVLCKLKSRLVKVEGCVRSHFLAEFGFLFYFGRRCLGHETLVSVAKSGTADSKVDAPLLL